jgi:hypothetical protein
MHILTVELICKLYYTIIQNIKFEAKINTFFHGYNQLFSEAQFFNILVTSKAVFYFIFLYELYSINLFEFSL